MNSSRSKIGFTFTEVLVASVILAVLLGGMLSLFFYCFSLNERSREYAIALAEAQNKLEEVRATGITSGYAFDLSQLAGKGIIYVDTSNPNLTKIKVVICWESNRDGRVIGEDKNSNGILDIGEDLNGNLELDSPIMLTTLLALRYGKP